VSSASELLDLSNQELLLVRELLVLLVIMERLEEREQLVLVPAKNALDLSWLLRVRDEDLRKRMRVSETFSQIRKIAERRNTRMMKKKL
jgi:hypothetical protein